MLQLEVSKQTQISKTTEALYHTINKGDLTGIKKALYPPNERILLSTQRTFIKIVHKTNPRKLRKRNNRVYSLTTRKLN